MARKASGIGRSLVAGSLVLGSVLTLAGMTPVTATTLEGGVQKEDESTRLVRPPSLTGNADNSMRLERPMPAPDFRGRPLTGMADTHSFGNPLQAHATSDDAKLGLLKPADFGTIPNSKFDLGSERGSKELTLAWEAWHKQLSHAIYVRWGQMASTPGQATLKIVVTKDRHIMPIMVHPSRNPEFDNGLLEAVRSLDGNPGLTFPTQSQRSQVSLEADYIAATDIQPGFSWVKNDYEHVSQGY